MDEKRNGVMNSRTSPRAFQKTLAKNVVSTLASARHPLVSFAIVFTVYGILSEFKLHPFLRPEFLPSYSVIADSLVYSISVGMLQSSIVASLIRVLEGYTFGIVVGLSLGFATGLWRKVDYFLDPLIGFLRYTPALALLPLYILWFGTGETTKVLLISTGVAVVTFVGTYHGVKDVPDVYIEAGLVLGADKKMLLRKVILPAASPQILAGARIAISTAWAIIVAAEIMGTAVGLGYLLNVGRQLVRVQLIFIGIVSIGILAYLTNQVLMLVHKHYTRWMKRAI